jgi:hypothetical protein
MALPGSRKTLLLERLQRLSHHGATDVERPAEDRFGWQQAAGRKAAGDDPVDEDVDDDDAQARRPAGKRVHRPLASGLGRWPGQRFRRG